MLRNGKWALLAFVLGAGLCLAQADKPKDVAKPTEQVLRFHDGTSARCVILHESLQIVTKYGKLTVPIHDLRRIDFGLHHLAGRVDELVKGLGSDQFEQREAASKELVALGARAYPSLQAVVKSADAEVARRAKAALDLITSRVPAGQLTLPEDDVVHTNGFIIPGRVLAVTIKVRTVYFGEVEVKVSELQSFSAVAGAAADAIEVVVDAAKYNDETGDWVDTGIAVKAGDPLVIAASGQISWKENGREVRAGPAGSNQHESPAGRRSGLLYGRIGGQGFQLGERWTGTPSRTGNLFLQIASNPEGRPNVGSYKVTIIRGQKSAPAP